MGGASGPGVGERRIVSVLFADIAGSTSIGEQLGPERSKFLFDEVLRLMRQEVERLGGIVAQQQGDGVFALFGAPTAHEDDAERAVRAALAIHESLARYDDDVGPAYGIQLQARVAVNTGPVVVPPGDEPPERLYNALGDTVNVAARLERFAGAGGVCVGDGTARQLGDTFELEPLGGVELRGKSAPVSAYIVTGEREPGAPRATGPLVGREDELGDLETVFEGLLEGAGVVVSLTGEPGIGKSRLLAEVRERYGGRVRFVEGHAVAQGQDRPYWPVRDLLRDWLGLGLSDPEARVRIELRAGLARALEADADAAYPFLATLLGLTLEGEDERRIGELSRDSVQRQTVDWLLRLFAGLTRERPLCLVLEDLESADDATLTLLDALLPVTETEPIGVVLVHRSDPDHEAWQVVDRARRRYRHRFRELELGALGPEAAHELAAERAGAELPTAVGELLIERSGGNPFFLEEALRDLVERGALVRENGRLRLAEYDQALVVPALVQEALQARLDRLAGETREVIAVAAVIGRSFGLPLLERLVERSQLETALPELQRLELVVEERRQPAREYRFRHGLVQEVAYAQLVEARRRELHLAVGGALEDIHRGSVDEVYGLLAHHFSAADDAGQAADYLLKAGDAARMVYAEEEALAHYRAALGFLERLGDRERARSTLYKLALTHHLAFDFGRADEAYREAFRTGRPRLGATDGDCTEVVRLVVHVPEAGSLIPGGMYDLTYTWLQSSLYRGLVTIDRELNVVPAVAERIEVSADGRVYRFSIDHGARWSDGTPVTAQDFVTSLAGMRADEAPAVQILDDVAEAAALTERTLEVRLRHARNYFPYLLTLWWYPWPRHRIEELGDGWRRPENLVTNGPFLVDELQGERMRFLANPHWRGRRGNVRTAEFRLVPYDDRDTERRTWMEGWSDIGFSGEREMVDAPDTLVEFWPMLHVRFLYLSGRPPLDDERVRRALAHAIDRERLQERIVAERRLAPQRTIAATRGGLIPPAMPGHGHRAGLPYDPSEARSLLAQAGYPKGRGLGLIEVMTHEEVFARALVEQLADVGIETRYDIEPRLGLGRIGVGSAHVEWHSWQADYPDPDGVVGTLSDIAFRDAETRALRASAAASTNRDERLRRYQALDSHIVSARAHAVPLLYFRAMTVRRPWINGFWESPLLMAPFDELVVTRR